MRRSWNVTKGSYNSTTLTVTAEVYYGNNQYKTVKWPMTIYIAGTCPPNSKGIPGTPMWEAWFTGTSGSTTITTDVTGETNSVTEDVTVYAFCQY